MAKATRLKTTASTSPVPQNRDEAVNELRLIGEAGRDLKRLTAEMNDKVNALKQDYQRVADAINAEVAARTQALKTWCEAHRQELTAGKVKFADLGTGKIEWRSLPPSVRISNQDAVLEHLISHGLTEFVRVKHEINREAMREDADAARKVPGVTIGSAGEEFIVTPFEIQLATQ